MFSLVSPNGTERNETCNRICSERKSRAEQNRTEQNKEPIELCLFICHAFMSFHPLWGTTFSYEYLLNCLMSVSKYAFIRLCYVFHDPLMCFDLNVRKFPPKTKPTMRKKTTHLMLGPGV